MKRLRREKASEKVKKEWTPNPYIKSHLRKIWRWSPARRLCLKAKRCCLCGSTAKLYADHINPVVDTRTGFTTWDNYIERLFKGSLQPLCDVCHKAKSKEENRLRRILRKEIKARKVVNEN